MELTGHYKVYGDGVLLSETPNLIVDDGHELFCDFMEKKTNNFIEYIGIGHGNTAPSSDDFGLQSEYIRRAVEHIEASPTFDSVSYTVAFPPGIGTGKVGEFATFNGDKIYPRTLVSTFDLDHDGWTPGTQATDIWLGESEKSLSLTDNQATELVRSFNFSELSDSDEAQLWIYSTGTITTGTLRFTTSTGNYYEKSWSGPAANYTNYYLLACSQEDFTPTGTPDWANIISIQIQIDTSGPACNLLSLSWNPIYDDDAMFSRTILNSPVPKADTMELLVVYQLNVSWP